MEFWFLWRVYDEGKAILGPEVGSSRRGDAGNVNVNDGRALRLFDFPHATNL